MTTDLNPRLDCVYRAFDDYLTQAKEAAEVLSDYTNKCHDVKRFDEQARHRLRNATRGAIALSNLLTAACRDIGEVDPSAPRIEFDEATCAVNASAVWGEVDLTGEMAIFLHEEAQRWQRILA